MRIAVVGAGVAGLYAAWRLSGEHQVTLYEAAAYAGGHTNTVDVEADGRSWAIDTGFIVFNDWTYPNFIGMLRELGVPWQASDMSFSLRCERSGLEYNGTSVDALFAQRRNLFRPSFHRMIRDILRFNREAPALLDTDDEVALGNYLESNGYSQAFIENYLIPMGAAIWSTDPARMLAFPARYFTRFFANHGMLSVNTRPQWRAIRGGSARYVEKLVAPFRDRIRLDTPVQSIRRSHHGVMVKARNAPPARFDHVFLACHSDQALALLADATPLEREILGAIPYQRNEAVLHTDTRLLPRARRA